MSIKVIYVMGFVRSGSTLLDILLGSQQSGFSAEELNNLIGAMDVRREYCACDRLSSECDFWRRVRAEWSERCGDTHSTPYEELRNRFERLRYMRRLLSNKALEYIGDMAQVDFRSAQERLESGALKPSHSIAGNRLRMQDEIRIRPDESWRKELSHAQ